LIVGLALNCFGKGLHLQLKDGAKSFWFQLDARRGQVFADEKLILLEKFSFARDVEINSAARRVEKVVVIENVHVEEIECEPINQRVAEFFDEVECETGATVINGVIESQVGVETDAVEHRLEFGADDDVAEREHGVDWVLRRPAGARNKLPGRIEHAAKELEIGGSGRAFESAQGFEGDER